MSSSDTTLDDASQAQSASDTEALAPPRGIGAGPELPGEPPGRGDIAGRYGRLGRRHGRIGTLGFMSCLVAVLFALPVASVLFNVFVPSEGAWGHLAETVLPNYVANTFWLVLGVGLGVLVIGTGTAWLVTMCSFPGRRLLEWALILPLAVPAYVMAYTYTDFLQFTGPVQSLLREVTGWGPRAYWFPEIRSLGGAIAMLSLVLYPYVYLLSRATFMEQSICALEVSRTLGCGAWGSFLRVALPLARPGIAAGVALALMETLADFGTVSYFSVQTFTTGIYKAWFSMGDRVAAAQLSAVLLGFVAFVLLIERLSRGRARFYNTTTKYQRLPDYPLRGWRAAGVIAACTLPVALGFVLPAAILLHMSLDLDVSPFTGRFMDLALNSFTLAAITSALAVTLALMMAYGLRLNPHRAIATANRAAGLGYAVPGSVIAVGVLIPMALFDNALDSWARAALGVSTGLIFTGTIVALIYAYLVRFLAVSLNTVEASLGKVKPSMDDAARNLGEGPVGTLTKVHAPLMWGSLLTAALVVFVDVMKELPATLIMRPFNFDTLAVQAHNLAADERLAEASAPALAIVAVGVLPVIVLSRAIARSRPGGPR
ncbi:MAG: iron ABC transporter permease [Rhodovibrionaceae bacterium]|nr:iron ABC transporter permease [Rhodovibrionaceae bacterium]